MDVKKELIRAAAVTAASVVLVGAASAISSVLPASSAESVVGAPKVVSDEASGTYSGVGHITVEGVSYKKVETPTAASSDGVVSAAEWEEAFPNQVQTMKANAKNSIQTDYIEEDPYIANLYEGYGFAIDYKSARGHEYDLEDVHDTARPHASANCLTCKTPNFTKLVNDIGVDAYSMDFEEVYSSLNEGISCYNCHGNDVGASDTAATLVMTHSYTADALGDSAAEMDPANIACGQCHTEYYFKKDTLEATVPYSSPEDMTPEAELAYYNEIGFSDWTQESTGTGMLKVQHPEFETVQQSSHAAMGLNCADCHMAVKTADDGTVYHSHEWVSPLEDESILANCAVCHEDTDMAELVHATQETVTARETEVGEQLSDLKDALAAAVESGDFSEDELNEIRQLYRDGQFYWDYSYVENSEGAHNSQLDLDCLDRAEEKTQEAMKLLEA